MKKIEIEKVNDRLYFRKPEKSWESLYNDSTKYKTYNKDNRPTGDILTILENIPEFRNNGSITITNTGLIVISDTEAYDMLREKGEFFDKIEVDLTSTIEGYTFNNNPLGVRRLNINSNNQIVGNVYFKDSSGNYCFELDCDRIDGELPGDDGLFRMEGYEFDLSEIEFEYKQCLYCTIGNDVKVSLDFSDSFSEYINLGSLEDKLTDLEITDNNQYLEVR